jgi:hypothetical protein
LKNKKIILIMKNIAKKRERKEQKKSRKDRKKRTDRMRT